jgi:AraC family transcriptional regulator
MEGREALPLNRPTAMLGAGNAVLRARARAHFVRDYPGPLSIKSVSEGAVEWRVGGRNLPVDPDTFLVLNAGEPYSLNIDSRAPVSTLCVFFAEGFVESIRAAIESDAIDGGSAPCGFLERLHLRDDRILPRMQAIARGSAGALWLDQQYLHLATDLLRLDAGFRRRLRLMPARKPSTAAELLRRVRRGQEYLHAHAASDVDLESVAREACLSPYHFHRAFSRLFGTTPHRYRNELRLNRARRLLEHPGASVAEACAAAGFESAASFSLLFRRTFGVPPSAVRK